MSDKIPYGYCQCGCGQKTKIAERSHTNKSVKGQPMKFINGHNKRVPLLKRFYDKITRRSDNECWEWTAEKDDDGYGKIEVDYKKESAHRISYILHNGQIPDDRIIRHTCDNPSCVNPNHLIVGTYQDNTDDMMNRNRANPRKGEGHPYAKITEKDVREIRAIGTSKQLQEIADQYQVSKITIFDILHHKTWKHVK